MEIYSEYTFDHVNGVAYCHHCPTVLRRSRDHVGLILAIHHHLDRKHP
jgi:hypothetical protein